MSIHRWLLTVRSTPWRSTTFALATSAMLFTHLASHAAGPWVPARDSEVVEVLRERPASEQDKAWRALRVQARAQPANVPLAVAVASQALQWSRLDGDPRWLGQAQGALGHWWAQPSPPAEVRLLRATLLQSNHDFDAALRDLRALVQLPPDGLSAQQRTQAWLTLATVLQVTAQYDDAQRACEALASVASAWLSQVCALELRSQRGDAQAAQKGLEELAQQAPREWASHLQLVRAELAERLGQGREAGVLYQTLLLRQADAYTEGAYADLLLDQGRAAEVMTLLKGRERNDALLLRLAEAGAQTKDTANAARVSALRARFAAARERGDTVHSREEARFTLRLLGQPAQALKLAQRNWQVQKEPADARILLEAARAAGHEASIAEVRAFMRQWGWSDRRLEALL